MKTRCITTTALFIFICCFSINAISQNNTDLVSVLNIVLKKSLYETSVKIDDKGVVTRKDNNGNTFEFNLNDVENILYDDDGFSNLIIKLKEGKKAKAVMAKKNTEISIIVISFKEKTDCDKAIEIFNTLIKKNE